jgi:hypothetical protein
MATSIKPLVFVAAAIASPVAEAQLLGPSFESNITLTREDLDMMRQTVA